MVRDNRVSSGALIVGCVLWDTFGDDMGNAFENDKMEIGAFEAVFFDCACGAIFEANTEPGLL